MRARFRGQSLLYSALRTRLQIEGVTLHFLDDLFRLHLALEAAQGILDGLTLLQTVITPISSDTSSKFTALIGLPAAEVKAFVDTVPLPQGERE